MKAPLSLMKERFWWPGMSQVLVMAVSNCGCCKQFEAKPQIPGMQPIICTKSMELVHIDYVGMEVTVLTQEKPVVKNMLVVVDHFTQYVQAYVTWNQTVRTTKMPEWLAHLGSVLIAYNATRSLVTGYSPYCLMFGWRPWLPIDLLFPTHREHNLTCTIDEYVEMLYRRLWKSVKIAQDSALKEALQQKCLYDRKVGAVELKSGDHVLVKLDAFHGHRQKLKNRWGSDLHTVQTHVADGVPTYVVKNVRTGKMKVLHHSRLLLWLADFGEPMQMNCMCTSITLQEIPENPLQGSEDGGPVPGCVMCGLNLAKLWIIVDTLESMTCQVACEVHTGALRNGTGLRIELQVEEDSNPECLGSFVGDVLCS